MKKINISVLFLSVLVGCSSPQAHQPAPQRGIAFRALELESSCWNRAKATKVLDSLVHKACSEISLSQQGTELVQKLERIHRIILGEGFKITSGRSSSVCTFGDGLVARELDCSDLTLIYLEVLERSGIPAHVAFARYHVLLALQDGELLWETTLGSRVSLHAVEEFTDTPHEMVISNIYLIPLSSEIVLSAVYIEMAQKLSRENKLVRAGACYGKAIEIHPRFVAGLQSFAAFLARQKRYHEAASVAQRAIVLDPANPVLYDFAAVLYWIMEDNQRALEMCEKAAEYGTINEGTRDLYELLVLLRKLNK